MSLLLVCPSDVIRLQGLPLMFQELRVPENLGPVVLLHDEGPEGAVLDASVPNLKAVGAGASLLEGNLSLLVPSVGDEFVMVHKSLEGVFST